MQPCFECRERTLDVPGGAVEFTSEDIRRSHGQPGALPSKERCACGGVANHRDTAGAPMCQVDLADAIEVHVVDFVHPIEDLEGAAPLLTVRRGRGRGEQIRLGPRPVARLLPVDAEPLGIHGTASRLEVRGERGVHGLSQRRRRCRVEQVAQHGVLEAEARPERVVVRQHEPRAVHPVDRREGVLEHRDERAALDFLASRGIPLVINIAAAPPITEQGYKFVFRNFPTGVMILRDAFLNQKEIFQITGSAPKTAVMLHVNDTYGSSIQKGMAAMFPKFDMPYQILQEIAYDPTARDLSVEIAKAKATGAEALIAVSRLNDAILLTRELIKQRWTPMAVLAIGPGWYEDQYLKTLGKLSDGPISLVPWYDPNKKLSKVLEGALAKAYPGVGMSTNHVYTFEALLVASDAFKRAGSTNPTALADAIRKTNITNNVSPGQYYICIQAEDGVNSAISCSEAPGLTPAQARAKGQALSAPPLIRKVS